MLLNQPLALEMFRGRWVSSKNLIPAGVSLLVVETDSGKIKEWCEISGYLGGEKGMNASKRSFKSEGV